MNTIQLKAKIYRGYDADFTLEVPADGYLGWDTRTVEINPEKTAVVVMHAWNVGTPEEYPGVFRANEYVLRSYEVCKKVFPELLETVRNSPLRLYHNYSIRMFICEKIKEEAKLFLYFRSNYLFKLFVDNLDAFSCRFVNGLDYLQRFVSVDTSQTDFCVLVVSYAFHKVTNFAYIT